MAIRKAGVISIILILVLWSLGAMNYSVALVQESFYESDLDDSLIKDIENQFNSDLISLPPINGISTADYLVSDNPPDILNIGQTSETWDDIVKAGVIASFPPSDQLKQDLGTMSPIVRSAIQRTLMTDDGLLLGYPTYVNISPLLFLVSDSWNRSPFANTIPPRSFTELLDFIELYLSTPHDGYCFMYDINGMGPYFLVDRCVECWIIQSREQGSFPSFIDDEFISLLERTRELASALYGNESKKYCKNQHQLFSTLYWGNTENAKDTYVWNDMIPWRITLEQQPYVHVGMTVCCIRKGSTLEPIATQIIETIIKNRSTPYRGNIYWWNYFYPHPEEVNVKKFNKWEGDSNKFLHTTQDFVDSVREIDQYASPTTVCVTSFPFYRSDMIDIEDKAYADFLKYNINGSEFARLLDYINR